MVGAVASQALTLTVTDHIAKRARDFFYKKNLALNDSAKCPAAMRYVQFPG